jgi:hypothetical protein
MFYSHAVESIPCLEPKGEPASIARLDAAARRHLKPHIAITAVNNR